MQGRAPVSDARPCGFCEGGMVMKNMAQRLLACILMCAVVTGALAVYASNPPSGDIPADMPGLAEWTERMPDAVHFQLITWRTNNALFAASLDDAAEAAPEEAWSVSSYVLAYDAQYNAIGSYYPPEDETDTPAMTTNEYDESGNLVRSVSYQDGQPYIETQTTYDSAGRIQTHTSWRQEEEIDRVVYDYTPQPDGTLVRRARSDASGRVETDVINAAGQWLSSEWEGGSSSAAYDGQGRPTETVIETKTLSQRTEYTYQDAPDSSYTCVAATYQNGALHQRTEQQFDAHGICVSEALYNAEDALLSDMTAIPFTP